ncbi:MAG: carbohydrate-binding protein, partial [Bacteroidia bacterium]
MEKLNRGVVAVETANGIFLSWRKFVSEPDSVTFNIYRNKVLLNATPVEEVSNFFDSTGTRDNYYYIETLLNGVVIERSEPALVWENGYKEIPLQTPLGYSPNDATIADLDGDGEFEIVVKMLGASRDNSQAGTTDPVFLHAYEMNGTLIWSIDLGINIRAGAHYNPFMVYDLNGDGKAEVAVKTAPGTKDGSGNYLSDGLAANDDDLADYRNADGYILTGPEYLTLFEGKTGTEISTVDYVPARGNVGDWGDTYGNRVDRFLACVAYFDSIPSLVMQRGYYTRVSMAAWDYVNGELVQRWVFDTDSAFVGKDGNPYHLYEGQGASSLTLGDIDGDGFDEIIYGSAAVDHDGVGLYTVGNNHGDASHLGDFIP